VDDRPRKAESRAVKVLVGPYFSARRSAVIAFSTGPACRDRVPWPDRWPCG